MKPTILKLAFLLLPIFTLLSACEEDIDLKLKTDYSRLVVDALITTDTTTHQVKLTRSGGYFDNKPMLGISGAVVTLSDGEETITLTESLTNPGIYNTPDDYYGKQNKLYRLTIDEVDINGDGNMETYSAESFLNPVIITDSISIDYHRVWNLWQIKLHAQDPPDEENFYWFRLFINDEPYSRRFSKSEATSDVFFDGNYADGVWIFALDTEEDENLFPGDVVMMESYMIDKTFYNYILAVKQETMPKTPLFSGPPANVPGNISNGALGYFAACAVHRNTTINLYSEEEMRAR
jgi:hypothetical protein